MISLKLNRRRLERTLDELARIGADPRGGVSRLGLSAAENEARGYLSDVSRDAGLVPEIDPAGNLLIRRASSDPELPVLLIGSHIDTVIQGGRLDGAYGVIAALEVLTVLAENDADCKWEPVAVGFANEEGALIQYPFWGSRALAGQMPGALDACDRYGCLVSPYLVAAGGDPTRLADAAWAPGRIGGYLELHIEQGPVLEQRKMAIGVVDNIVGRTIFEIFISGESGHPGTMPMSGRKDALAAAAQLILNVESISAGLAVCATSTVGYIDVTPNTTNVIPGAARLTAEIRDSDRSRIRTGESLVKSMAVDLSKRRGVEIGVRKAHHYEPVSTDPLIRAAIRDAASTLGLGYMAMPSGAGHDAQIVASIAPVGMIFVPSSNGVSHIPTEHTAESALAAGAEVLLESVLNIQKRVTSDSGL